MVSLGSMRRGTIFFLAVVLMSFGLVEASSAKQVNLWSGQVKFKVPAGTTSFRAEGNTWLYYPKGKNPGVALIVLREKLRSSQRTARMAAVARPLIKGLGTVGWKVSSTKSTANTFQTTFSGPADRDTLPWLKEGQVIKARGQVRAIRTRSGHMIVAVLLAENAKWFRSSTKAYRKALGSLKVKN